MTSKRQSRFGDIAAAFMLLSRIPVTYQFAKDSPPDFISSLWAFPLVGIVIGGVGGIMLALASFLNLPALVCGGLCVGVMAMASGAMHEDGLADTADGFGGGRHAADKMRDMTDSHRSEERPGGKGSRTRGAPGRYKKNSGRAMVSQAQCDTHSVCDYT